jgi:hypothetical protein
MTKHEGEAAMKQDPKTAGKKRWVPAPPSDPPDVMHSGQITGVYLAPDEEVEWHWTHSPDGTSVVTGYTLKKKGTT